MNPMLCLKNYQKNLELTTRGKRMKITKNQLKQMIKEEMEKEQRLSESIESSQRSNLRTEGKWTMVTPEYLEKKRKERELRKKRMAEPPPSRPAPSMPEVEEASIDAMRKVASDRTSSERGYKSNSYSIRLSENPGSEVEEQIKDIRSRLGGMPGTVLGYYKDGEQVFAYLRVNTF